MKTEKTSRPFRTPLLAAMAAGASLIVGPLVSAVVDLPTVEHAYAKGGKGGKGGGHGGGGGASAGKGSGQGLGHAKARGLGHGKGHATRAASKVDGISASALGRLNAAHASQRARDRAAPNSTVGLIADYQKAVAGGAEPDIAAAAEALAAAANKPIDSGVVGAVNGRLGIGTDAATNDAIADAAAALQAPEAVEAAGGDPVQ